MASRRPVARTIVALAANLLTAGAAAGELRTVASGEPVAGEIGGRRVVAHFTAVGGRCELAVLVDETAMRRRALDLPLTPAARLRVSLARGESATVDTAEAGVASFTCDGERLIVDMQPMRAQLVSR